MYCIFNGNCPSHIKKILNLCQYIIIIFTFLGHLLMCDLFLFAVEKIKTKFKDPRSAYCKLIRTGEVGPSVLQVDQPTGVEAAELGLSG